MRTFVIHENDDGSRYVFEVALTDGIILTCGPGLYYAWRPAWETRITIEGIVLREGTWAGDDDFGDLHQVREIER